MKVVHAFVLINKPNVVDNFTTYENKLVVTKTDGPQGLVQIDLYKFFTVNELKDDPKLDIGKFVSDKHNGWNINDPPSMFVEHHGIKYQLESVSMTFATEFIEGECCGGGCCRDY